MESLNRRQLLLGTSSAFAIPGSFALGQQKSSGEQAGRSSKPEWYRSLLVGMELGPTGANNQDSIYMSQATGQKWVDALVRGGAEYGVIFMKDQNFTYYNSKTARKCPNLGSRDLLAECIAAARPHQIPIIAYCQIQYDTSAWTAHPEWRMQDSKGDYIPGRLCYNTSYFDYNQRVAAEMLEYGIHGFHFDMLDFGFGPPVGCWCPVCRELFKQEYDMELPDGVAWDDAWDKMLQFRCDSNTRFCRRLGAFVHQTKPDASVDYNYHGYPPFSWYPGEKPMQHARNGDFVTAEGLPWVFGNYNPSLLSLFLAGARPEGPVQVATSRSVYNYHDFTIRPVADLEWEVLTYLSHGVQCTMVNKANYDGSLDPVVYDRLGKIYRSARKKRDTFGHKPLQDLGLYYSCRSRDWYGRLNSEKYTAAFSGAHKALVQAHILFGMVMDEKVSVERLRAFPMVYVPNAAILTPHEVETFKSYVEQGGNMLITGVTGLYDSRGEVQNHSSLAELAGVRLRDCQAKFPDNYLRLPSSLSEGPGRFLTADVPLDWPILTWGPIGIYEANGAKAFGELMVAFRPAPSAWSHHMSPDKVVGPAVFVHRYGKGRVVLVPAVLDAAFIQRYRMPEHRNLIRNLVRYLLPDPVVRIEAPASVETVVTQDTAHHRFLVHCISFAAPPTASGAAFDKGRQVFPPTMEEPVLYEAHITLNRSFSSALSLDGGARVTVDGRRITLSTREVHTVVGVDL